MHCSVSDLLYLILTPLKLCLTYRMVVGICLQEHLVKTCHGYVSVAVIGDQDKPALVTYPDLALNCK